MLRLALIWGELARPTVAPPGTPEHVVHALREAFEKTMKDPAFLADATESGLSVEAVSGPRIAAMITEIYRTPPDIVEQAAALLQRR